MRKVLLLRTLGSLMVLAASGALAADGPKGVTWLVEMVAGAGTIDTGQTSFLISDEGRVATTIGCNRMAGAAKIDGEKISIGPIIATRMACAPALMKQEQIYGAALEKAATWSIEDGMLKLKDAGGAVLVSFARGG